MKKMLFFALAACIGIMSYAQPPKTNSSQKTVYAANPGKTQTVTIQTNGVCQKCADLFKEKVPFFKGVKDYSYDMATAKMVIKYDSGKTNPAALRQEISKLGYNADDVKADPIARKKLPACCQKETQPSPHQGCPNQHNCSGGQHH